MAGRRHVARRQGCERSLPYEKVAMLIAPDYSIRELEVTGRDESTLNFSFSDETVNPKVNDELFRFAIPPGAEVVDAVNTARRELDAWRNFFLRYADTARSHPRAGGRSGDRTRGAGAAGPAGLPRLFGTPRDLGARLGGVGPAQETVNLEKFLIFNQQFVTLIRAGLPILKGLDLLAERLTDPKLGPSHQGRARRGARRHRAVRSIRAARTSFRRSTSPR